MAALVWLLIPLLGVLVAVLWARWAARARTNADGASLAGYERFRTAMQPAEHPPLTITKGETDETDAEPV
ncbi:hypothetical protein [Actinacidiphila epipremni]|uniref:Uncharacterized protein n=1 Tax=Actinacidiphila epipremni TaxID=2053013 RepID=A0ABX0ZKL8_9ACTN|nr:hypothetical protein [Actinacidiphila epipremni]NJP42404.1 hypothetical protein [Actinacidiphila epipremni]